MATLQGETQAIIDAFAGRQLFKCENGIFEGPSTSWTTVSMPRSTGVIIEQLERAAPRASKRQKIEATSLDHAAVYKFLTMSKRFFKDPKTFETLLDAILPGATLADVHTASLSKDYQNFCKAKLQRLRERKIASQKVEAQTILPSPSEEDANEQDGISQQIKEESEQPQDTPVVADEDEFDADLQRSKRDNAQHDLWDILDDDMEGYDEELSDDDLDERIRALERQFGHGKDDKSYDHDDDTSYERMASQDVDFRDGGASLAPTDVAPDDTPVTVPFGLEFFTDHQKSNDMHDLGDVNTLHIPRQSSAYETIENGACERTDPLLQGLIDLKREQELYDDYDAEYHLRAT